MATTAPAYPIAVEYASLLDKKRASGLRPTERYRAAARRLLDDPRELVQIFGSSIEQATDYFVRNDPGDDRLYGSDRAALEPDAGLESTAAVGALMEKRGRRRWDLLGNDSLSFHSIDRELLVTQAKGLADPDSPGTASLRMDLLLASAEDGLPIVCELKVTSPEQESPDKNPVLRADPGPRVRELPAPTAADASANPTRQWTTAEGRRRQAGHLRAHRP